MTNKIREDLQARERATPNLVIGRLKRGTIVQRGSDQYYEIDDPDIDLTLGKYDDGQVPLKKIYISTKPNLKAINNLFSDRRVISFSEVFNKGFGACLEKSILVQLASQRSRNSFLVTGLMGIEEDGIVPLENHSYNIIFKDGKAFLVDSQNPKQTNPSFIPYTAPINGINNGGDFLIPDEWKQKRTYSI